jgi:hypothetical protein
MPLNLRVDDAAEFNRLCDALPIAIGRAGHALRNPFSSSAYCLAARARVAEILARITLISNELK